MIELELKGNYYDIGFFLGKQFDSYKSSYFSNNFTKEQHAFAHECEMIVKQFFPELLDEIQGIADGGDVDYNDLITSELGMGFKSGCTVFAIPAKSSKKKKIIFASSMDWFEQAIPFTYIFRTNPENKLPSLGFSEYIVGRLGGINEAGLALAESNCTWDDFEPGFNGGIIGRYILDNCEDVKQAVDFLQKIPHILGNNYLIADKHNNAARVEAFKRETVVTSIQDDFVANANHYFSPVFDSVTPTKPQHSLDRIEFLSNWYRTLLDPVDIESVKQIQKTHEVEICPHVQEYFNDELMDLTTCWAWVTEVGSNEVHLCRGSPCKNEYKKHYLF